MRASRCSVRCAEVRWCGPGPLHRLRSGGVRPSTWSTSATRINRPRGLGVDRLDGIGTRPRPAAPPGGSAGSERTEVGAPRPPRPLHRRTAGRSSCRERASIRWTETTLERWRVPAPAHNLDQHLGASEQCPRCSRSSRLSVRSWPASEAEPPLLHQPEGAERHEARSCHTGRVHSHGKWGRDHPLPASACSSK